MKNKYRNRLNIHADLGVKISGTQLNFDEILNEKKRFYSSGKVRKSMQ